MFSSPCSSATGEAVPSRIDSIEPLDEGPEALIAFDLAAGDTEQRAQPRPAQIERGGKVAGEAGQCRGKATLPWVSTVMVCQSAVIRPLVPTISIRFTSGELQSESDTSPIPARGREQDPDLFHSGLAHHSRVVTHHLRLARDR